MGRIGDIYRPKIESATMIMRVQSGRGNAGYRFSSTTTLSDVPLLIGEILRRSDLRVEQRARRRARLRKLKGIFALR